MIILSIHNELTDFKFTKVAFFASNYRYYRLLIASKEKPGLIAAKVSQQEITMGSYKETPFRSVKITEHKAHKQTHNTIEWPSKVPVNYLKINVTDTFYYYRPVTIEYVSDSVKTEKKDKQRHGTPVPKQGMARVDNGSDYRFAGRIYSKHDEEEVGSGQWAVDVHANLFKSSRVPGIVNRLI